MIFRFKWLVALNRSGHCKQEDKIGNGNKSRRKKPDQKADNKQPSILFIHRRSQVLIVR